MYTPANFQTPKPFLTPSKMCWRGGNSVRIHRWSATRFELTVGLHLSDILTASIYGIYSIYTWHHCVRTLRVCTRPYPPIHHWPSVPRALPVVTVVLVQAVLRSLPGFCFPKKSPTGLLLRNEGWGLSKLTIFMFLLVFIFVSFLHFWRENRVFAVESPYQLVANFPRELPVLGG
jgi:hypothetical protein